MNIFVKTELLTMQYEKAVTQKHPERLKKKKNIYKTVRQAKTK